MLSGVMMTTPCGHSAPTQREPLPYALCQPNSPSRHGLLLGTGWPIVTGQCRAPAIVTGDAALAGGAALAGDAALAGGPVLVGGAVLAGPPVQPGQARLRP